jgi:hypothetical protein
MILKHDIFYPAKLTLGWYHYAVQARQSFSYHVL